MIERFQTSFLQMGFGVSSTSLGQVLTSNHFNNIWTHIGRVAIIIGILASIISVINGVILLRKNARKSKIVVAMRKTATEFSIRLKRKTPSFYKGMIKVLTSLGVASGTVLVVIPQFNIQLPIVEVVCGYMVVLSVFGVVLAQSTCENPKAIKRYLEKLYSTKR